MSNKNNPNNPANHAESPVGANNEGVPQDDKATGGANAPKNLSIIDIPEEYREVVNSAIAASRRDGREQGKKDASKEAEDLSDAERQSELIKQQKFEPLYNDEKGKREKAEKRADAAEKGLMALEVALEMKLPNPHLAAKRLIGDTREDLVEDAKSLLKVLKSDEDVKKPKDDKKPDASNEPNPPVTSQGGDNDKVTQESLDEQDAKYVNQRSNATYNF